MNKSVDYELQDASVLLERVAANNEVLTQKGYTSAKLDALSSAFQEAKTKNTAQVKAVKLMNEKTIEQDLVFTSVLKSIVKIQKAAKSANGEDPVTKKKFKIGDTQPRSVKSLITWGEYFTSLLLEHDTVLLQNGLVQQDLADFNSMLTRLRAVDPSQESAKKLQVAATLSRDNSVKKLKDLVNRTRNFVKAAFSGNQEMLIQFQPLQKGRGGGSNGKPDNPSGAQ